MQCLFTYCGLLRLLRLLCRVRCGPLWTRTVQDFQRSRPKSCLMWQLADGRLARHDGTFPPLGSPAEVRESLTSNLGATRSEEDDPNEGDMTAQLIWHHDVRQQTWPQTKQPSFCNR